MMIPFKVKTFSFLLACACSTAGMAQVGNDSPVKQVKISGYVGTRITDCIEHRVKAQDVDHLVEPFRHQNEKSRWQSEFWGKWIQGAIASYRYNRDPELYQIIRMRPNRLWQRSCRTVISGIMRRNTSYSNGMSGGASIHHWD